MAELLTSPRELLAGRLRQLLWIELVLAERALPALLAGAHAADLRDGLERHLHETRGHADALRDVLPELRAPADPEQSPALQGILEEHGRLLKRLRGEGRLLSDLAHAQAAAATEHLELAAYESLTSLAEALGEDGIAHRLRAVLEEEQLALERVGRVTTKLLAERVASERLERSPTGPSRR
ncbi:MAG TPA: DUF892 family protein [Gaiellaceae bacterium]|nr:DUF892 family protein [Gaiellaceae bacterium]